MLLKTNVPHAVLWQKQQTFKQIINQSLILSVTEILPIFQTVTYFVQMNLGKW